MGHARRRRGCSWARLDVVGFGVAVTRVVGMEGRIWGEWCWGVVVHYPIL